jgi:hypothetical protein
MLPSVRTSPLGRLAAALVALGLTGTPTLAARPQGEHGCQCRAHGHHECECLQCRRMAALARRAAAERAPPCHQKAAAAEAERSPQGPPGPCIAGSCGTPEDRAATNLRPDSFTLPRVRALSILPLLGVGPDRPVGAPRDLPRAPETPPPRAV